MLDFVLEPVKPPFVARNEMSYYRPRKNLAQVSSETCSDADCGVMVMTHNMTSRENGQ
jgi:hypothetical protein